MQTYFSLGLIQMHAHTHTRACTQTHTQLVKHFGKCWLWKKKGKFFLEGVVVLVELLRCVLPSLPWVGG